MKQTMTALVLFTTGAVIAPVAAADVTDADALAIVRRHCSACHAAQPTHAAFREAPKGVVLETVADLKKHARLTMAQTVESQAMPLGNETAMTEGERAALGRWLKAIE